MLDRVVLVLLRPDVARGDVGAIAEVVAAEHALLRRAVVEVVVEQVVARRPLDDGAVVELGGQPTAPVPAAEAELRELRAAGLRRELADRDSSTSAVSVVWPQNSAIAHARPSRQASASRRTSAISHGSATTATRPSNVADERQRLARRSRRARRCCRARRAPRRAWWRCGSGRARGRLRPTSRTRARRRPRRTRAVAISSARDDAAGGGLLAHVLVGRVRDLGGVGPSPTSASTSAPVHACARQLVDDATEPHRRPPRPRAAACSKASSRRTPVSRIM